MSSIPTTRFIARAAMGLFLAGCAHTGQAPDLRTSGPAEPTPVALRHVAEIRQGTPIRVLLPNGDSTAGFFLGMAELDASGIAGRRPALRLGTGSAELWDRTFQNRTPLLGSTTGQVPDTVLYAMDRVQGVLVPGPELVPPPHTPAIVVVVGILVVIGALLGLAFVIWPPSAKPL